MQNTFSLLDNYPAFALPSLRTSGATVIDRLGMEVVKDVIFQVLTGENIRDSTEMLTRRRITMVNLGIVSLFLTALTEEAGYRRTLIEAAKSALTSRGSASPNVFRHHALYTLSQCLYAITLKLYCVVLREPSENLLIRRGVMSTSLDSPSRISSDMHTPTAGASLNP